MTILQGMLMGAVQGAAAFFPVSGSGLLVILGRILGIESSVNLAVLVWMQLGVLAGLLAVFWPDVKKIILTTAEMGHNLLISSRNWLMKGRGPDPADRQHVLHGSFRRFTILLFTAVLPTCLAGIVLYKVAEAAAENLLLTAMGFLLTALMLLVASYAQSKRKNPALAGLPDALLVGVLQGIAVLPGVSRLGMVCAGAGLCGFTSKFKVRFVFLLGIPAIVAALVFQLFIASEYPWQTIGIGSCIAGFLSSFLVSILFAKKGIRVIRTGRKGWAAILCLGFGVVAAALYLI